MRMEGSPFLPLSEGLHIGRVTVSANELLVQVLSSSPKACCPLCGAQAERIHSRYTRQVADLPCVGRHVTLLLTVRKFFCPTATCPRTIFAEQFPELVPSYARLTTRLREALVALGFATSGGRPRIRAKIYQRSLVRLLKVIGGHAFRSSSHSPRLELSCLLGAAALLIRLVLQGPQGAQRRLLGLGEPPDARDSEALVGPVTAQGAQGFAAVHIPEPDGPIIAATGDSFAIGTDLEGLHLPLMGFSHPQAALVGPAERSVPAGARSLPSLPPLSSRSPTGCQATASSTLASPCRAARRSPLWASHTKSSPPSLPPPEASRLPSGLQTTLRTGPRCPESRRNCVPSEASHTEMWPSSPPPTRRVPSGLQATRKIQVACACPTPRWEPVVTFHTRTPCSTVPQAS